MLILILAIIGLAMGSFVNALVWRLHEQTKTKRSEAKNLSILRGRSMCVHCHHELAAKDLVPVLSWLQLRGKCRYCRKPISAQYPLVELATMAVFVLSYVWWPLNLADHSARLLLITWLVSSVGLMALLVYDFKWLILPNRLVYPTLAAALAGRLGYILCFSGRPIHHLGQLVLSVAAASGIFWLLFEVSNGRWIGFGDVRLGLVLGCLLASPSLSILMIFLASVLGLLAFLIGTFGSNRSFSQKIPYGPFLIIGTWLAIVFGQSLINWYTHLLS